MAVREAVAANENAGVGRDIMERDVPFSRTDFDRVRKLIYARAGISLSEAKQQMAYSRLSRRVRATGAGGFTEYLDQLERNGGAEWQEFINSLTTNLTYFFREQHHFPIFADYARKVQAASGRPARVWCSAASTGEEPYSIAITLAEIGQTQAKVLCTDIDTNVLAHAARAVYRDEAVKPVEAALLKKYFLRGSANNSGMVRLRPDLARMCEFQQLNLIEDRFPGGDPYDVIFCRNVMIYFDKPTQLRILEKFAGVLKKGGLLFAGHSENFSDARAMFALRGKTVYERL
jgi:chemotaxis protein methyltransferase CheR